MKGDCGDVPLDELKALAQHNLETLGLDPLRIMLGVRAGPRVPHDVGPHDLVDSVHLVEGRAERADRMDIRPFAFVIHFDLHPIEDPLDHVPPGAIVELRATSLGLEQVELGEEGDMAFSMDGLDVIEKAEADYLAVERNFALAG